MGVREEKRTYTTPFKPTSTTNWLLGNVGDWQRLSLDVEYRVRENFAISNPLTITNPNTLTLSSGNWGDLGFAVGQTVTLKFKYVDLTNGNIFPNTRTFTVGLISGPDMECFSAGTTNPLSSWSYNRSQTMPYKDSVTQITNVYIYTDVKPQGISLNYSHFTNSSAASGNIISFNDGTKTGFQAEDTDLLPLNTPTPFTHTLTPFQSGMCIELATVEYLGKTGLNRYHYRIDVIFMIGAFFEDINNFINNIAPDFLKGSESLTDGYLTVGSPVYNNPNVSIKNDPKRTQKDGNVGWFDENFNQLPNLFTHTPVVYTNLAGTVVNQLDYANPIKVRTTISGINNLTGATMFQYGFAWLPIDEDIYKEKLDPYHKITLVSTGGQADTLSDVFPLSNTVNSPFPLIRSGYSVDGVSGLDASDIIFAQNGSDVEMSVTFRPSANFAAFMDSLSEDERNYCLWVSVGDQSLDTNKSDRVSLLLDFNKLVTFVEPIGEYEGLTIDFLDHPQDENDTPILCGNSLYVEDDLLAKVQFEIDTATGPDIPIPTGITFGVLVDNNLTGQQYVLDKSEVDLTPFPNPTQFNFSQERGFKLGTLNNKNFFKVLYDGAGVGTLEKVLGLYGFKVRWEDWIKLFPLAPNDFYNNNLSQNGQNNDWYDYFNTSGWNLYFYVEISALLNNTSVVYQNLKRMVVKDYDSNPTITTTINYYRDIPGSPPTKGAILNGGTDPVFGGPLGVIIDNEFVWLDILYTSSVPVADWADQITVDNSVYATQCIEVENGAGQFEFRQLSSIWLPEFSNPMIPVPSETLSKVTFISTTQIRVETRIEANKLIDAPRYKITGREGCK